MITVKPDSVGGDRCLIFYRDGKPIFTWWEKPDQGLYAELSLKIEDLEVEEILKLLETLKALGLEYPGVVAAVETFLKG